MTWDSPEVALALGAAVKCSQMEQEDWDSPLDQANVEVLIDRWYALVDALGREPENPEIKDAILAHARTILAFAW